MSDTRVRVYPPFYLMHRVNVSVILDEHRQTTLVELGIESSSHVRQVPQLKCLGRNYGYTIYELVMNMSPQRCPDGTKYAININLSEGRVRYTR